MARVVWIPLSQPEIDDILFFIAFVDLRPRTGEGLCLAEGQVRDGGAMTCVSLSSRRST